MGSVSVKGVTVQVVLLNGMMDHVLEPHSVLVIQILISGVTQHIIENYAHLNVRHETRLVVLHVSHLG